MNRDIVQGNWNQFKGRVAVPWGNLTDDGRQALAGVRVEMEDRLQESYRPSTNQTEQRIKVFAHVAKDYRLKRLS
jgi:uncharacterized protein YjbJ (UPF0337 family)